MSDLDDELESGRSRSPLVTVLLGVGVVAAVVFYFMSGPSFAPTGDAFIDAACDLGDEVITVHLCAPPAATQAPHMREAPLWFARVSSVPGQEANSGYNAAVNEAIDLSVTFEQAGQPLEAAKARIYAGLVAMGIGELGGARGQLEDAKMLARTAPDDEGEAISHLTGLYLAQISWRLSDFEDGHDEIRAFVSRSLNFEPWVQKFAARGFSEFITSEERSGITEWVIEDYRMIRELYQAHEDWRRIGLAWYLQGQTEAATGDYRRASLTFGTAEEVFGQSGFKELQAESYLRHADLMRDRVPALANSLEAKAAEIFVSIGIDPRAAKTQPLTLMLYDPKKDG